MKVCQVSDYLLNSFRVKHDLDMFSCDSPIGPVLHITLPETALFTCLFSAFLVGQGSSLGSLMLNA